jgi:hypothetical protein
MYELLINSPRSAASYPVDAGLAEAFEVYA